MKPAKKSGGHAGREPSPSGANTLGYDESVAAGHGGDESGSGVRKIQEPRPAPPLEEPGLALPAQIGPYRLLECIGEGAMGHVYRAEHTLLGRVVAIKMLRRELSRDGACVERFLAEARAVNLIKHPHIIDVTDIACTEEGQPWFVMEMLDGSDLSLAVAREALSLERTLEIMRQLCEALVSVHTAGVVHRDVKPENIFLQQRDDQDFVTLIDFGIARLPDPTNADPRQEGLMGTAFYMAPEQASASPIDHRADLYAVGSTLFELISGHTPFRSELLQKQLVDVLTTPAPRLSDRAKLPAIVRDDLDRLVERLLAKQPSERPASAREVADELARIAEKLAARTSSPRSESAPPVLRLSVPSVAPPQAIDKRKRARRAARAASARTARRAIILSALFTAAAIWVATQEGSWMRVLVRALSWPDRALPIEQVVQPSQPSLPPADTTQATSSGLALDLDVDQAPEPPRAERDDDSLNQRDRRFARGEEAVEQEVTSAPIEQVPSEQLEQEVASEEQPLLRIEPSEPRPVDDAPPPSAPRQSASADDGPAYDHDLVLNPFE